MTYTKEEEKFILENYKTLSVTKIASILNRKVPAIIIKARRLGLARKGYFDYESNFNLGESLLNPKFIYLLGFIWADGHLTRERKRFGLAIELKSTDGESLKELFSSIVPMRYRLYEKKDGYKTSAFYCRNKELCSFLGENDYCIKSFCEPTKILSKIKQDFHIFFWKGFFDGDGSISPNGRHRLVSFYGPYDYKWEELTNFFSKLEISAKIRKTIGVYGNNSQFYFCRGHWVEKFFKLIYPNGYDFGLKRKYDKFIIPPLKINYHKRDVS
ncbi:MAG: hypothetical protein FMNOHCHN_03419 [Ignavibacteriaceae bacterium]|nr:hypothetical protein [Ignavibacteriaceae bacterium]